MQEFRLWGVFQDPDVSQFDCQPVAAPVEADTDVPTSWCQMSLQPGSAYWQVCLMWTCFADQPGRFCTLAVPVVLPCRINPDTDQDFITDRFTFVCITCLCTGTEIDGCQFGRSKSG